MRSSSFSLSSFSLSSFWMVCVAGFLWGCECGATEEAGGESAPPGTEPGSTETGIPMGTVEGVVRLAEGSETPRYATNPLEGAGATALPDDCTPPRTTDREPLAMADDRGLRYVPIVGLGDAAHWPARGAPRSIDVHIRDCRLDPPVLTATAGDVLRIHNDLMYPFFPTLGATGFVQAVLPGEPREMELDAARPVTLECTTTARCGRAEIMVLGSPVHVVSGEGGHFTLSIPADQDIELVAWHPLIQEASMHTRVAEGETVTVEIEVHAAPQAAPATSPPSVDRPEDHPELGPF